MKNRPVNKEVWGIIPARGGSKSIPLKNMARLDGRPLVEYVIDAAKASGTIDRIMCSTDHKTIERFCRAKGIEVHKRPAGLSKDKTPVADVVRRLVKERHEREGRMPAMIALLQPTSPFVLPGHIDTCVRRLKRDARINSAQTIVHCPHTFHAFNQRIVKNGLVRFRFAGERRVCYNKQTKPDFYTFGNLVVTRTEALLRTKRIFAQPSAYSLIPFQYALDIDGPWDLKAAEALLQTGVLKYEE